MVNLWLIYGQSIINLWWIYGESMVHWLVLEPTPLSKYEFISWNDEIPNIWKHIECSKPPTRWTFHENSIETVSKTKGSIAMESWIRRFGLHLVLHPQPKWRLWLLEMGLGQNMEMGRRIEERWIDDCKEKIAWFSHGSTNVGTAIINHPPNHYKWVV